MLCSVQHGGGVPGLLPIPVCLDHEVDDARRRNRGDGADRGLVIQQQHLLEADVSDLEVLAEGHVSRGQRHLAVGGPHEDSNVVYLMVPKPGLCRAADLSPPNVPLRLLLQAHMRPQQRMHRNGVSAMCLGVLSVGAQQQTTVGPGGQRRVHQPPSGVQHGEVDRRARAVHVRQEAAQSVRQLLPTAHGGQSGYRHVDAAGRLLDSAGEQRVG